MRFKNTPRKIYISPRLYMSRYCIAVVAVGRNGCFILAFIHASAFTLMRYANSSNATWIDDGTHAANNLLQKENVTARVPMIQVLDCFSCKLPIASGIRS